MATKKQVAIENTLVNILRSKAQQYLKYPNITSVGVGYKQKDGKVTDELCIQFTVKRKLAPEHVAAEGLRLLPPYIETDDGKKVPIDVLERVYHPSYEIVRDPEAEAIKEEPTPRQTRRMRLDTILPGISVSHTRGTAGTLGAIVYDNHSGQPYILSNWHVLQGPEGLLDDAIVQPGPFDNSDIDNNFMGKLVRSHLGLAGDCAIASIERRRFDEAILELEVTPKRTAKVNLGDRVVKSGRTTGVTHGIVQRIGVVANIDYRGSVGVQSIGGFEIGPNPNKPAPNGEVSMGGDSGSLWLIDDGEDNRDIAVGLHFAGEVDPDPAAEHALACNIHSVLQKLDVDFVEQEPSLLDDEELFNEILTRLDALAMRLSLLEQQKCSCESGQGGRLSVRGTAEQRGARPEGLSLPVYGNWCGPGHGGGRPIDALDEVCKRHDKCYDAKGYFDCECDINLLRDIDQALASGRVEPLGRVIGPLIRQWFIHQPCFYHVNGLSVPGGTGGTSDLAGGAVATVKKVVRGGKKLWKKVKNWF